MRKDSFTSLSINDSSGEGNILGYLKQTIIFSALHSTD